MNKMMSKNETLWAKTKIKMPHGSRFSTDSSRRLFFLRKIGQILDRPARQADFVFRCSFEGLFEEVAKRMRVLSQGVTV